MSAMTDAEGRRRVCGEPVQSWWRARGGQAQDRRRAVSEAVRGRTEGSTHGRYPRRMPSRPTRRSLLAAALAAPVASAAGCTVSGPAASKGAARETPDVDPDVALLEEVSQQTDALVALYEGVVDEHRSLRRDLRPLLAAHRAHADALGQAAPKDAEGGTARRGTSSTEEPHVPRRPEQALRRLQSTERDTSQRLLEATRQAESGGFARLLASMSASSAQAVHVLGELSGGGGR